MPLKPEITSLDEDLRASRMVKYNDSNLQFEVKEWIKFIFDNEIAISNKIDSQDLMDSLKDGTVLCEIINKVFGFSIKFKNSSIAFVQMENIEKFINFCKSPACGVSQDELFQTIDLFESNDPYQVIVTIRALSRIIHERSNGKYPLIGPKISKKHTPPPIPKKPKSLVMGKGGVPWSSIEYGYMGGSNQAKENVVFGGRRQIIHKD
ncbi:Scp1 protein [Martiniozyma asiatica (nom. inval.)]|nr:Scp1 protein [Martiniozyma asiatica]